MKRIWHVSLCTALWCACTLSVLASGTVLPAEAASSVAEQIQPVVITDPAVHMKNTSIMLHQAAYMMPSQELLREFPVKRQDSHKIRDDTITG